MEKTGQQKVGVYVDSANIAQSGGYGMHYDVLRDFACRNQGIAMRLNAYVAFDDEKAKVNKEYARNSHNFHSILRDFGFKVIVKNVHWYVDESNVRYGKANADLDMAVDALLQSERLDYVLIATGDGDFIQVIRALQNRGCRVEVLAFKNVSQSLKREADVYTSGYLVPELLTTENDNGVKWGEVGSRVRGNCYSYFHNNGYGFLRFLKKYNAPMWITDSRKDISPYETVFVHETQLPENVEPHQLPNREMIFEFKIVNSEKGLQAVDLKLIHHN